MKPIQFIIFLLFISKIIAVAKDTRANHFVTGIEIQNITKNTVVLKWISDQEKAQFYIYYNKKQVISDKIVLKNSKLSAKPYLEGQRTERGYIYQYELKLKNPGIYYFAVLIEEDIDINKISQGIVDIAITDNQYLAIPEINSTVQPAYLIEKKEEKVLPKMEEDLQIEDTDVLITKLEIEETEKIFKLRWFVYPKDKTHYLFKIYRSKYPISRFESPKGLPEYARVENQFYFEDTNISLETPYYYAVVAENTNQWEIGINVFKYPAVLLNKSPLLKYEAIPEYVKKKEKLNIRNNILIPEEEMQKTVKHTLKNLMLSSHKESMCPKNEISVEEQINRSRVNNSSNLSKVKTSGKFSKYKQTSMLLVKETFMQNIENIRNESRKKISDLEQNIIKKDNKEFFQLKSLYKAIISEIKNVSSLEETIGSTIEVSRDAEKILWDKYIKSTKEIDSLKKTLKLKISEQITLRSKREDHLGFLVAKIREEDTEKMLQVYLSFLKEMKAEKKSEIVALNANRIDLNFLEKRMQYEGREYREYETKVAKINHEISLIEKEIKGFDLHMKRLPERFTSKLIPLKTAKESVASTIKTYGDLAVFSSFNDSSNRFHTKYPKNIAYEKMKFFLIKNKEFLGDMDWKRFTEKYVGISKELAIIEAKNALSFSQSKDAIYLLSMVLDNPESWNLLGKSYYFSGRCYDALSIFLITKKMGMPGSEEWLSKSIEKIEGYR